MKKRLFKYVLPTIGSLSVLLFCVSATASITNAPMIMASQFSGPTNMILLGIGMLGLAKSLR